MSRSLLVSGILSLLILLLASSSNGYIEKPGPKYVPTVGYPWPMPKVWTKSDNVYSIDGEEFKFRVVDNTCDILEEAIKRYQKIVDQFKRNRPSRRRYTRRGQRQPEQVEHPLISEVGSGQMLRYLASEGQEGSAVGPRVVICGVSD